MEPAERLKFLALSDNELMERALGATAGSVVYDLALSILNMRCVKNIATATGALATANAELVKTTQDILAAHHDIHAETKNLVTVTKYLVIATGILALFTLAPVILDHFFPKPPVHDFVQQILRT